MADANLFKGGTPHVNFMNCDGHTVTSGPPFGYRGYKRTPPFNSHYDGAYNAVDFAAGMPLNPRDMPWQRDNLKAFNPGVGDIIRMIVIPANHYCPAVRFDVCAYDARLAGMTAVVTAQSCIWNETTKEFEWTEIPDVTDAATAQGIAAPIPLDVPSTQTIWLTKVTGAADPDSGDVSGYAIPLYVNQYMVQVTDAATSVTTLERRSPAIALGLKVMALPTDAATGASLATTTSDMYLSARLTGFECMVTM